MKFTVTVAPSLEPVTVSEIKQHLNITHSDDDDILDGYIIAARLAVEHNTNRFLITQTVKRTLNGFSPSRYLSLKTAPVQSVSHVKYLSSGSLTTFGSANYRTDLVSIPCQIALTDGEIWPTTDNEINAVEITFVAGYGNLATDVPEPLKMAIRFLVGHWYANRESVVVQPSVSIAEVPQTFEYLISQYRIF